MPADKKPEVNLSRIYAISELRAQFGVDTDHLLLMAMQVRVKLCVRIPPHARAYVVDPMTVNVGNDEVAMEQIGQARRKPDPVSGKPLAAPRDIAAMIVDFNDCRRVANLGRISRRLFSSAYIECGGVSVLDGSDIATAPFLPKRPPFFTADGALLDQSGSRLAIYPDPYKFKFRAGVGYQTPIPIDISKTTLSIVGVELAAYLSKNPRPSVREEPKGDPAPVTDDAVKNPSPIIKKAAPVIPPSLATVAPSLKVPSGIRHVYAIAVEVWGGTSDDGNWRQYRSSKKDSAEKILESIKSGKLNLRADQVAAIASLIQPAWADRNKDESIRDATVTDLSWRLRRLLDVAKKTSDRKVGAPDWKRVKSDLTDIQGVGYRLTGSQADAAVRLLRAP